nr:hypothetical protein GCM10020093_017100 [Planobispora longispora]
MKDELVALVSHELRNPIGTIRGYVEMLLETAALSETQRKFADIIDRTSAHLLHLVDDLLDLTRLDTGQITVEARPVSLTRLVRQAVDDHRGAAVAKRLTVDVETAPPLPVHADPLRLRQVLDNLLSNAIKYTPDGGAVTITAGPRGGDPAPATRTARARSSRSPTPASASRRNSTASCSPGSSARPPPARPGSRAPAWAWPSPRPSSKPTAARSPPPAGRRRHRGHRPVPPHRGRSLLNRPGPSPPGSRGREPRGSGHGVRRSRPSTPERADGTAIRRHRRPARSGRRPHPGQRLGAPRR